MLFIVATNVIASRPPERRPTGMPHARANKDNLKNEVDLKHEEDLKNENNLNTNLEERGALSHRL